MIEVLDYRLEDVWVSRRVVFLYILASVSSLCDFILIWCVCMKCFCSACICTYVSANDILMLFVVCRIYTTLLSYMYSWFFSPQLNICLCMCVHMCLRDWLNAVEAITYSSLPYTQSIVLPSDRCIGLSSRRCFMCRPFFLGMCDWLDAVEAINFASLLYTQSIVLSCDRSIGLSTLRCLSVANQEISLYCLYCNVCMWLFFVVNVSVVRVYVRMCGQEIFLFCL